jgi:hypothetical protein
VIAIELEVESEPKFLSQFAALSQLQNVDINAICRELNVMPVSSFLDQYRFDAGEDDDASTWYSAEDGAKTFSALAQHMPQYRDGLLDIDQEQLRCELDDASELLTKAALAETRFHLVVVIIPPGMEELIGQ